MEKTVIVTGAAKGIGKAIAQNLVNSGYKVLAVDPDEVNGRALEKSLPGKLDYAAIDICDETAVAALFSQLQKEGTHLYGLVNNAGILRDNVIWKMPTEDFDAVLNVNLKGTWLMCKAAASIFKENKQGRIVNIASRAWLGNPGQSNYSASKAGVVALTRVLALELGRYGVLVNAVAPGLIDTPMTQKLTDDVRQKLIEAQPTRSMGSPADVANAVGFLLHPQTQFITGQTLYVDGGKSIGAGL